MSLNMKINGCLSDKDCKCRSIDDYPHCKHTAMDPFERKFCSLCGLKWSYLYFNGEIPMPDNHKWQCDEDCPI